MFMNLYILNTEFLMFSKNIKYVNIKSGALLFSSEKNLNKKIKYIYSKF